MDSPESDSTESACCELDGEDPNDPEWTVADDRDTEKERIRPTAKRQDIKLLLNTVCLRRYYMQKLPVNCYIYLSVM